MNRQPRTIPQIGAVIETCFILVLADDNGNSGGCTLVSLHDVEMK